MNIVTCFTIHFFFIFNATTTTDTFSLPHPLPIQVPADTAHAYKAVLVVHNETSTGVTTDIRAIRRAIDTAGHPALLLVDTVRDRKSTRLNSSHANISYAVFCLKKKKKTQSSLYYY